MDELIATCLFLRRRKRAGAPILRVFLTGGIDDGPDDGRDERFERPARAVPRDMFGRGVSPSWGLTVSVAVGNWLMFTRLSLGTGDILADTVHLIGALAATLAVMTMAESLRTAKFLNLCPDVALAICALVNDATWLQAGADIAAGVPLVIVSLPREPARHSYGNWSRVVV
ncbi:hypothetical protein [Pseudooceanicola aestuarii]|uniref:hypothetical protein n=1 Tax=Pseudooceanicola aestuarii TaxID=2697319 RepID=UPI0013D8D783|nr:hypothetical protein [Pseudooceanicola aestuarii]